MDPALNATDWALAWTIGIGLALRLAGMLLGSRLRPDAPAVAWASAVSVATLACFVALAIAAPSGLLASVPLPARLAGLVGAALAWRAFGGRLLPALAAGVAALLAARLLTG